MAQGGGSGDEGDCAGWVDAGDGGGESELLILVCGNGGDVVRLVKVGKRVGAGGAGRVAGAGLS